MTSSILSRAFGFKSNTRNRRPEDKGAEKGSKKEEFRFYPAGMEFAISASR